MSGTGVLSSTRAAITPLTPLLVGITCSTATPALVITSASYMLFGVTNYTNQISDLESASASGTISELEKITSIHHVISGVENGQTMGLLICMTVLPCALMLLSYFLYQKKYTLDEEEYERICKEIAAKKEA